MSTDTIRTYDGGGNNLANPDWGRANTQLRRLAPPDYKDKYSTLAERRSGGGPNPREVSNKVCKANNPPASANNLTDFIWAWGQFLDHELDLTKTGTESANIQVPPGDPDFHPGSFIPFKRSLFDDTTGTGVGNPRQQTNLVSSYIDGSNIYGSDPARAAALRTHDGTGRLRVTESPHGDLLPFNLPGLDNAMQNDTDDPTAYFLSGDIRANEHAVLTCMHTLFMREHNRVCLELPQRFPKLAGDDEATYQLARKVVGGIMQAITFNEFLPRLLGPNAIPPYTGYKNGVEASVSNAFSTAAYRLGHSMLSSDLRLGSAGERIRLRDSFFQPRLVRFMGIEPFLEGRYNQVMQEVDTRIVEDVRVFLFSPPTDDPQPFLDLAALNIQRGRDHGLPGYNTLRQAVGLPKLTSFNGITTKAPLRNKLKQLYGTVDAIDPWIGGLAEDHAPGSNVGPFVLAVLVEQFVRLRDGDRFWFQHDPALDPLRAEIEGTTLAEVLLRDTKLVGVPPGVF